jgi:small subunit ribosomal protein S2
MTKLPGALFVVDIKREHLAVSEADRLGIPVFGVVDTNADPTSILYPIPGNDDASKSIYLMVSEIADAIMEGSIARKKEKAAEEAKQEETTQVAQAETE